MLILPLIVHVWLQFTLMNADPFLRYIPPSQIPATLSSKATVGIGSIYGRPKDSSKGKGSLLACAPDYRVQSMPEMNVCASRTYKCGTILAVQNVRNKKTTLCRVMDRGPYGALLEDGTWVVKIKKTDPGTWRGIVDLTPAVAAAIGHKGFEKVRIEPVYTPKKKLVIKTKKTKPKRKVREQRPNV